MVDLASPLSRAHQTGFVKDSHTAKDVAISHVRLGDGNYYRISNCDELRPFFMSVVSDSDHWMFIASNGGLSAGRKDAQHALFPYYTDDKITESAETTGSTSVFRVQRGNGMTLWEPFSDRYGTTYRVSRNLYKHEHGNKILFEEINHDLELTFRYQWASSDRYGFVKTSTLINHSRREMRVEILDGIQNILPSGVESDVQNRTSNLVDAYKRSELQKDTGLGIYALNAYIVDKAEPSESLKANIVWSLGLIAPTYLLSSLQLKAFRRGEPVQEENDIRAEKGAYFVCEKAILPADTQREWMIVANVNQNHSTIAALSESIKGDSDLEERVKEDVRLGAKRLLELNAASDALQCTADQYRDARHFSNVLFNIMRGGIFDHNYQIEKWDFNQYLRKANREVFEARAKELKDLPDVFSLSALNAVVRQSDDADFSRLCLEYMPLKFSRRHGDPSRPWNTFSINMRNEIDGSKTFDYEGNWRDIFQNWEALAYSYPGFIEHMIFKFLNASTFDGYNPYRITKDGFDWEIIEADDPWSYIGYWGDHQIIYLLKFLEFTEDHFPGHLEEYFSRELFVYANVPYQIKPYEAILENPKDTIDFDHALDEEIRRHRLELGADAALLRDESGAIYKVNFMEKVLATVLAKLSNFIPEAGIWMNTQRPEWNDANNALVGQGVSMVTLYYLRRFLAFFARLLANSPLERISISNELIIFYRQISTALETHKDLLAGPINDIDRRRILDSLGEAGSDYRHHIYRQGFWGTKRTISLNGLKQFVDLSLSYIEHSIEANKRPDHLYHAYNLMAVEDDGGVSIARLSEMLEGQVAVLSTGHLSARQALRLLDALRNSALFREDQNSYVLYPDKELPGFMEKNRIPAEAVAQSPLLASLVRAGNAQIIEKDIHGHHHFNGNFKNANDLKAALEKLEQTDYASLVEKDGATVLRIFEAVFQHKSFTGRSTTFFGYEGLGSIYWHMVSKLQLAVQECCVRAIENNENDDVVDRLIDHYYEINDGIGIHKSPSVYGAFPTDPYSHTPAGKGAQQPGMTGQVKEDILSRFGELGVFVHEGKIHFRPYILHKDEFIRTPKTFSYVDVYGTHKQLPLDASSLGFTYCQVPIVYVLAKENALTIVHSDNRTTSFRYHTLDTMTSKQIFERTGDISQVIVHLSEADLR